MVKTIPIDGIDITTIVPMVNQIAKQLNDKILFLDDPQLNNFTTRDDDNLTQEDSIFDNFMGGDNLDVTYSLIPTEEFNLHNVTYKTLSKPILLDKDVMFVTVPYFLKHKLNIEFTIRSTSKQELNRVKQNLHFYMNNSMGTFFFNTEISYYLPDTLISLINDIKNLKYNNEYDFFKYLEEIALFRVDYGIKRGNSYKRPYHRLKFLNIMGTLANEIENNVTRESDIEYSYRLQFEMLVDIPYSVVVDYRPIVNNKKLPDRWLSSPVVLVDVESPYTIDFDNLTNRIKYEYKKEFDICMKIPAYDDFYPRDYAQPEVQLCLLSILLTIDENDPYFIMDMYDLIKLGAPEKFVKYLLDDKRNPFVLGGSLFRIKLFENNDIVDKGFYYKGSKLYTIEPLDKSKLNHLIITIIRDFNVIEYKNNKEMLDEDIRLAKDIKLDFLLNNNYGKDFILTNKEL